MGGLAYLTLAALGTAAYATMMYLVMGMFNPAKPSDFTYRFEGERESGYICYDNSTGGKTTCSTVWTTPKLWTPGICEGVTAQDTSVCTIGIIKEHLTNAQCVRLLVHAEYIHLGLGSAGDCVRE